MTFAGVASLFLQPSTPDTLQECGCAALGCAVFCQSAVAPTASRCTLHASSGWGIVMRKVVVGMMLLGLGACATADKAYFSRGYCEEAAVRSPDGGCRAFYKQTWGPQSMTIAGIVSCSVDGAGQGRRFITYGGHPEDGVALRWLSDDRLEVAAPPGVGGERYATFTWFADGGIETMPPQPRTDQDEEGDRGAALHRVQFSYRELTPKDREWNNSCYARRPKDM